MDTLVGLSTTREIYAELLGAPLTGVPYTYTLVSPTGATLINAAAATEVGGGFYAFAVDGSQYLTGPGLYRELWQGVSPGGLDVPLNAQFMVGYEVGPVVTRLELRHSIARLLGDLWTGQSTGSNTGATLHDTNRVEADNAWQGGQIYLYAGTGQGQSRNLLSSTQSGGVLTLGQNWTTTPDSTTLYELHRRFSVEAYNAAINEAIRSVSDKPLLRAVDETILLTTGTYEYVIPAGFSYLSQVSWKSTTTPTNDWQRLRPRQEWDLVPGLGKLHIDSPATNLRLRLEGHLAPPALLRDAAYCDLDPTYLKYMAACILAQSEIASPGRDLRAAAQASAYYRDEARAVEPRFAGTINARPV
jgi:hypothetical protein